MAGLSVGEYYATAAVRRRIREYGGATAPNEELSCISIAALNSGEGPRYRWELASMVPPVRLDDVLASGADFGRSLWDRRDVLFYLDLDYHNQDCPGEAFAHPLDTFAILEPVYRATRVLLRRFGIRALATVSGRGYHFVGRLDRESSVVNALAGLPSDAPHWVRSYERRREPWMPSVMPEHDARVYSGLGMITEHLGHLIQKRAARTARLPVVFNGTAVGAARLGRESVSIDLSHFGDPLDQRHVRSAFSTYQLHLHRPDIFGIWPARHLPALATVLRTSDNLLPLIDSGRTLERAIVQATRESAVLPETSEGVARLLDHYSRSRLAAFHTRFTRELADASAEPSLPVQMDVPPCVAQPLRWPNDLLLRPEYIQHVARYFLAAGWPAGRIAALLSSLYTTDGIWGSHWERVDPRARAEFDVRVFAGLVATGRDRALDFNCTSAQEKGLCPRGACSHDLRRDRALLLNREVTV